MAEKHQINLLKISNFEHSTTGKLIAWASNVGRWIVVLTEFVVITAFLSRFYFDTKLANLFDEVRQKKAIVNSLYSFEEQYRQAQSKILLAKLILTENNAPMAEVTDFIASKLPLDTTLTNLSVDLNTLRLDGYSLSTNGLQTFIDGIGGDKLIGDVQVDKMGSRSDGLPGISFSVTAKIKV